MTRSAAVSNDTVAEEAASDLLLSGGSAVAAVVAGFFAAAGAHAGVLLSPVSIVVAGSGAGARAFDGRLRQPGLGAKRPRGFKKGDAIPDAARLAIATGPHALLVAYTYDGGDRLVSVLKAGIDRASRAGARARASLLTRIRSAGAAALGEAGVVQAFLRAGGTSEGGAIVPADFSAVPEIDVPANRRAIAGVDLVEVPWALSGEKAALEGTHIGCAIAAIDARGVCAAVSYRRVLDGFLIDELELEAPLAAIPVERGVERVPPGGRLLASAPIGIVTDAACARVLCAPARPLLTAAEVAAPPLGVTRGSNREVSVVRA